MNSESENYEIVIVKDRKFNKSNCAIIVPKSYVTTNAQLNSFVRYLSPPYAEDDIDLISGFIKSKAEPPESWGSYKCEKRATAENYESALKIIQPVKEKLLKVFNKPKSTRAKKNSVLNNCISQFKKNVTFNKCLDQLKANDKPKGLLLTEEPKNNVQQTNKSLTTSPGFSKNFNLSAHQNDNFLVSSFQTINSDDSSIGQVPDDSYVSLKVKSIDELSNVNILDMEALLDVPSLSDNSLSNKIKDEIQKSPKRKIEDLEDKSIEEALKSKVPADNFNNATSACDSQCKKKKGVSVGIQVNLVYDISSEIVSKSDFIVHIADMKKTFSQEFSKLSSALRQDTKKMCSQISDQTNYLKSKENQSEKIFVSIQNIQDIFNYNFPLNSDEEFQIFENSIHKNLMNIRVLLITHFTQTINASNDLVDTLRDILRKFLRKTILMFYVAQKASGASKNKKVFKNTEFWTCVEESIMDVWIKAEKKIDHNDIMKTLGNALSNVRDWEKKSERLKEN